jgi:hypothetical protein
LSISIEGEYNGYPEGGLLFFSLNQEGNTEVHIVAADGQEVLGNRCYSEPRRVFSPGKALREFDFHITSDDYGNMSLFFNDIEMYQGVGGVGGTYDIYGVFGNPDGTFQEPVLLESGYEMNFEGSGLWILPYIGDETW